MRKALVVGAGGFLGAAVTERMMMHGYDVVAATRGIHHRICELCPLHVVDATNREDVFKLVGSTRPDVIVNCAGYSSTPGSIHSPEKSWEDNFDAAFNLLNAARVFRVERVVLASSNVVYGTHNPYRAAKLAMEGVAEAYSSTYGMSVFCLRYGNIFGEGCRRGFVAAAVDAWRRKAPLLLSSSRGFTRHWVHVDDAAECSAVAAGATGFRGWTDVAPDRETSLGEIIDCLPGLEVLQGGELPGDASRLRQSHCILMEKMRDVREWLCGL